MSRPDEAVPGERGDGGPGEGLDALFAEYAERLTSGERLDPKAILRDHPDVGKDLLEYLEDFVDLGSEEGRPCPLGSLGDYELLRQVGRGGMGVVYEAWEQSMDRRVALKVLPAGLAVDQKVSSRFLREARLAGKLHHPHVVPVFGIGITGDTPHYAMEFVEGETLAQVLARPRAAAGGREGGSAAEPPRTLLDTAEVTPEYCYRVARAFVGVAGGLHHAHSMGVIHRDIKPSNLILDREGRLRILDFGLARLEGEEGLTGSGDFLGTLLYMSPEQARRRRVPVDHRTDIYSLGATMYEALTRRPPFRGKDDRETLTWIVEKDPVEPRKLEPGIPRDLETIVLKCLEKDSEDRYRTAEAVGQDLERFTRGDLVEARPQSAWEKLARRLARHKVRLLAIASGTVLVLLSGWLALRLSSETEKTRKYQAMGYEKRVVDAAMKLLRGRTTLSSTGTGFASAGLFLPGEYRTAVDEHAKRAVEEALSELAGAIEALPGRFEGHFHRARGLRLLGRDEEALRELEEALRRKPGFAPARALRAELLKGKGDSGDVFTAEENAATEAWAKAWLGAHRAMQRRRWSEAARAYGELLTLHSKGLKEPYLGSAVETLLGRGMALLELKDLKGAQRDFVAAWTLWAQFLEPPLLLGKAYYLDGEKDEAERVFADLVGGAASKDEAGLWIASVYRSLGDIERALEWAARVGDEPLRERLRARCFGSLDRLEEALRAWRRVAELAPQDGEAHAELGWALVRNLWVQGEWSRFERGEVEPEEVRDLIEVSRKAVDLAPGNPLAMGLQQAVSRAIEMNRIGSGTGQGGIKVHERRTDMKRQGKTRMALAGALTLGLGGLQAQVPEGYFTQVRNLGPGVNTPFFEYSPSVSPDGKELYFTSWGNDPARAPSWQGGEDIWVAMRENKNAQFGNTKNIQDLASPGVVLNSVFHEGPGPVSFDNRDLYFISNRDGTFDLYVARRPEPGMPFETLVKLGPKVNKPDWNEWGGGITGDGLALYFTRNDPKLGEWGGENDIWVVTRGSSDEIFGEAGEAVLVEGVNSGYDEVKPGVSADGLILFFSDWVHHPVRPGGVGGGDIWVATRSETDPLFIFSVPVNLNNFWPGTDVNTVFGEGAESISADWPAASSKLYFTSNRPGTLGGSNDGDIWEATWVPGPPPPDPPRNLTAAAGDGKVDLAWEPAAAGTTAAGYDIYRSISPLAVLAKVNSDPVVDTRYTDTGLENGKKHCYRVKAVGEDEKESLYSNQACATPEAPEEVFRRGDSNGDGTLDLTDAVHVLAYLFIGGPPPACFDAADADDSGELDLSDAIYSLGFQFLGGPAPPDPGPSSCGPDPKADPFAACVYTRC